MLRNTQNFILISNFLIASTLFASAAQLGKKQEQKTAQPRIATITAAATTATSLNKIDPTKDPRWPQFNADFKRVTAKLFEGHFDRWDDYKTQKLAEHDWLPLEAVAEWFWKTEYPRYHIAYEDHYKKAFGEEPDIKLAHEIIHKNTDELSNAHKFDEQN